MPNDIKRKGVFFSSLSIAIFATLPLLNLIIMRLIGLGEGTLGLLYISSVGLVVFLTIIYNRRLIIPWGAFWMILITLIFVFFLTQVSAVPSTLKPEFFAICTISAFIAPQLVNINPKTTLRLMASLPAIGILFLSSFIADDGTVKMNVTYAFLVPITSALVYAFTYYKADDGKTKLLMTIVLIINLVFFVMCLFLGSRAPALSVIICFLFFLTIKIKNEKVGFSFKKNTWLYLVLPLVIALNFSFFLHLTADIFKNYGWEAMALDRIIALDELGALDSGRGEITRAAWRGIADNPIWGHGMSASEKFTDQSYPHNFLLQLLLDGGIILFIIIMVPFVLRLVKVKKTCFYDELTLLSALFFASVPAALFSLDLWENATFWLFMGFLFSKRFHLSFQKRIL